MRHSLMKVQQLPLYRFLPLLLLCNYSSLIYRSLPWVPLQDFPFYLSSKLYSTTHIFLQLALRYSADKFIPSPSSFPNSLFHLCPLPVFLSPLRGRPTLPSLCDTSLHLSSWTHCFLLLFSSHAPSFSLTPSVVSSSPNAALCLQTCSDLPRLKYISIELFFFTSLPSPSPVFWKAWSLLNNCA